MSFLDNRCRTSTNTNSTVLNVDDDIYIPRTLMTTIVIRKWKFMEQWIDWYIGCLKNLCLSWYTNIIIVVCCCFSEEWNVQKQNIFVLWKYSFPYTKHRRPIKCCASIWTYKKVCAAGIKSRRLCNNTQQWCINTSLSKSLVPV